MKMANALFPVENFSMERFNCPVCLDVLKEPVTTCCGHSFCKVCINGFWDRENEKGYYSCPQCRRTFAPRPDLYKNSMLAEMVEKLQALYPAQCYAGSGDVAGAHSTGRKEKACPNSSCETHLQPHLEVHVVKKHNLIELKLQEKICPQCDKPNEMDCTDQRYICSLCKLDKHKGHDAVAERPEKELQRMVSTSEPKSRDDFLKYYYYLTLDPNTSHKLLILSKENRMASSSCILHMYDDHPARFDSYYQVLCKEGVSGRCYWEVEWSCQTVVSISVSYKVIRRKGQGKECEFGCNYQSWSLCCSSSSVYFYHDDRKTDLKVSSSPRIGVYVDHSAGNLSFYSVSDTMSLIHRVHTTFTQPLYAGFGVYGGAVRLCDAK